MAERLVSLKTLAEGLAGVVEVDDAVIEVTDVTHNSLAVRAGVVFVAIRGSNHDGHEYVSMAAHAGAPAVVVDHRVDVDVPQIVVSDTRAAMPHIARAAHGSPDSSLSIVGITGTNGKTTVASMCESIWMAQGVPSGIIGTLGARLRGEPLPLERTTPESSDLQRMLALMRDGGVLNVAIEVSSHALVLHRADAVAFDVVAFTNLTQDHLDFHHDMEHYFAAKLSLFDRRRAEHAVVNISDAYGARVAATTDCPVTTVAVGADADFRADIDAQSDGMIRFTVRERGRAVAASMPLPGSFNVANAAVAWAISRHLGADTNSIVAGLSNLEPIAGRMQVVSPGTEVTVVVDYAHTPAAVATVVAAARDMTDGRVIAVVGAGGDRDEDKRPMMGAAAAASADVTIVTTDNPRSESPEAIADEVRRGAEGVFGASVETVLDRSEAIDHAVTIAHAGDLVLILGKGHELGQEVNGVVHPFDDVDEARRSLARHGMVAP
jgi:UDP-N-acetylmuramoyl-L-alanyl-D-glutamate--2,6-diaminopimelate ligase